jgi:uncharacterized membrane protein
VAAGCGSLAGLVGILGGMNIIWLIVGVLAIIALLIFIAPHFQ